MPFMSSKPSPSLEVVLARVRGSLYGMFIGDALAMPVHWYYDRARIYRDFGPKGITKYEAPVKTFPGSIMNLSNTGGGGRGSDKDSIIGDVLVKGKKQFWLQGGSYHYHHGMSPGENTLDTLVARLMIQVLGETPRRNLVDVYSSCGNTGNGVVDKNEFTETFLRKYIEFMTTKDSHNDVYVATAHRMFFANYVKDVDKFSCADNDGHNTDSVDGLINVGIVSLNQIVMDAAEGTGADGGSSSTSATMRTVISDSINLLRKSTILPVYGVIYHDLLVKLIVDQKPLRQAIVEIVENRKYREQFGNSINKKALDRFANSPPAADPMSACYITSNFPVTLLLAYKYHDSLEKALLASANAGGENVNRNALLGTIMGAALGAESGGVKEVEKWSKGLVYFAEIEPEIEKFLAPLRVLV